MFLFSFPSYWSLGVQVKVIFTNSFTCIYLFMQQLYPRGVVCSLNKTNSATRFGRSTNSLYCNHGAAWLHFQPITAQHSCKLLHIPPPSNTSRCLLAQPPWELCSHGLSALPPGASLWAPARRADVVGSTGSRTSWWKTWKRTRCETLFTFHG